MKILCQNLNVHHLVSHSTEKEERIDKFLQLLKEDKYDIVLIQELFVLTTLAKRWGGELRTKVIKAAGELGLIHSVVSKSANFVFGQDAGLIILSRYPVLSEYSVTFRDWGWKESTNKKGFIHAVLNVEPAGKVHVITTHGDAHDGAVREEQLKQMRRHIQGHTSPVDHVILGGNLNVTSSAPEFKQVRNMLHPLKDGWGTDISRHPNTVLGRSGCVDYIFYSPAFTVKAQTAQDHGLSDHLTITSEAELHTDTEEESN